MIYRFNSKIFFKGVIVNTYSDYVNKKNSWGIIY